MSEHPAPLSEKGDPVGMDRVNGELIVVEGDDVALRSENMKPVDVREYR